SQPHPGDDGVDDTGSAWARRRGEPGGRCAGQVRRTVADAGNYFMTAVPEERPERSGRPGVVVPDPTDAQSPRRAPAPAVVRRLRTFEFDTIERAIADIAAGKAILVVDDEDRENEGDLVFAAAKATPALLAFMIRHTSGVVCVPMPADDLDRLDLPPMTTVNQDRRRRLTPSPSTPATVSAPGSPRRTARTRSRFWSTRRPSRGS